MDPSRTDWYVRQRGFYLYVEPENTDDNRTLFQQDASFILHTDTFYPGYYAIEHINFANYYIRLRDDWYLWIENEAYTSAYRDAASFRLYEYSKSRTFHHLALLKAKRVNSVTCNPTQVNAPWFNHSPQAVSISDVWKAQLS